MNIDDLTYGQIKEIAKMACAPSAQLHQPFIIGQAYLVRCVTHYVLGRVVAVGQQELVLEDAGWVAATGRFAKCLSGLTLEEYEPAPDGPVIVGRGSIVDAYQWNGKLPRKVVE